MTRTNWWLAKMLILMKGNLERRGQAHAKGEKGGRTQSKEENVDARDNMACLVEELDEASDNHESCHTEVGKTAVEHAEGVACQLGILF